MTALTVPALAVSTSPVCTPGHDGIPDAPVGTLLCGQYVTDAPHQLAGWAATWWPALAALAGILLAGRISLTVARAVASRRQARGARWLQITPPVTATPATTVDLWRLAASLLSARRLRLVPPRLVWEIEAAKDRMRCGLWVPAGLNPTAVRRVVQKAWPGARLADCPHPTIHRRRHLVGRAMVPVRPDWQPLVDTDPTARRADDGDVDEVRAVFDGLAAAGRTGGGLLQIVVAPASRAQQAMLRRAMTDPTKARARGTAHAAGAVAGLLRGLIQAVLDLLQPGPSTAPTGGRVRDPEYGEQTRAARAKNAARPLFALHVRAVATGPSRAAARAAVADITGGFSLLTTGLVPRRLPRARARAAVRTVPASRRVLASVTDLAVLAGLPAEPSLYGLPAAPARRLPATGDMWRPPAPPHPDDPDQPWSPS
jgi:hypothetical protein